MRILALVHQFPPIFETGTELLCQAACGALGARGHEVLVVAADQTRWRRLAPRRERVAGLDVTRVPTGHAPSPRAAGRIVQGLGHPETTRRVANAIERFAPDVVHAHHLMHLGPGMLAGLAERRRVVVGATDYYLACPYATATLPDGEPCPGPSLERCVAHHLTPVTGTGRPMAPGALRTAVALAGRVGLDRAAPIAAAVAARRAALRPGLAAARRVLATSERIADMLIGEGADPARTVLIPHPPLDVGVDARPVGSPLVIAFLGSLLPHKGALALIEALTRLPLEVAWRAVVIGDRSKDPAYVAKLDAAAAGHARIEVRDRVPFAAVGSVLSEADVVVVPSLWRENRPHVLLDALEGRRYVVAFDQPGVTPEIAASGGGGEVVPAGDVAALAAVLERLARDPAPVAAFRARPRSRHPFAGYVDALETVYRDVMAEAA
jgi:glycosyltransferase involved in cell wall biosynthesis